MTALRVYELRCKCWKSLPMCINRGVIESVCVEKMKIKTNKHKIKDWLVPFRPSYLCQYGFRQWLYNLYKRGGWEVQLPCIFVCQKDKQPPPTDPPVYTILHTPSVYTHLPRWLQSTIAGVMVWLIAATCEWLQRLNCMWLEKVYHYSRMPESYE
jgi:hypothetical protein